VKKAKKAKKARGPVKKIAHRSKSAINGDIYSRLKTQSKEARSGSMFFKVPEGEKSKLRPFSFMHAGVEQLFINIRRHFNLGGDVSTCTCPGEENCPICALKDEVSERLWQGSRGQGGLKPSNKYLVNAVLRGAEDKQVIWELPKTVFASIGETVEANESTTAFDHKKGIDWVVSRATEKGFTRYKVNPITQPRPIGMEVKPVDLIAFQPAPLSDSELSDIAVQIASKNT